MDERMYKLHEAFDKALEESLEGKIPGDGYQLSLRYHHDSKKLEQFRLPYYEAYQVWAVELYLAGQRIASELSSLCSQVYNENPKWWHPKATRSLKSVLARLGSLEDDVNDFRQDAAECQRCWLASNISSKGSYIESLCDLTEQLSGLQDRISGSATSKLSQVSSARLAAASLFLSLVAIGVAVYARTVLRVVGG